MHWESLKAFRKALKEERDYGRHSEFQYVVTGADFGEHCWWELMVEVKRRGNVVKKVVGVFLGWLDV
jgi:hypothetical protein